MVNGEILIAVNFAEKLLNILLFTGEKEKNRFSRGLIFMFTH